MLRHRSTTLAHPFHRAASQLEARAARAGDPPDLSPNTGRSRTPSSHRCSTRWHGAALGDMLDSRRCASARRRGAGVGVRFAAAARARSWKMQRGVKTHEARKDGETRKPVLPSDASGETTDRIHDEKCALTRAPERSVSRCHRIGSSWHSERCPVCPLTVKLSGARNRRATARRDREQ